MPSCFVVQGFHKKTDFESGRVLDLDASYEVIKEAAETAGYECVRADEIAHSRNIDLVMYERLLTADLVIADLSTSNVNAFYELGVRFALRPYRTIVVAEDRLNFPFDVDHIPIRTYTHLGDDIGRREAKRFIGELGDLIRSISDAEPTTDSPVFTFLTALRPPVTEPELDSVAMAACVDDEPSESLSDLQNRAKAAMSASDFAAAVPLWTELRARGPKDDYIVQQLALATYKSEQPSPIEALHAALDILEYLWPSTSLDPETLGLWAAVNKRLHEIEGDPRVLDEAITATEKGWVLRNDYYNGINLAFLLDTRAAANDVVLAREDHSRAQGVRRQVVAICEQLVDAGELEGDANYWVRATLEEAHQGLGNSSAAARWHAEAVATAGAEWMVESTAGQLGKLDELTRIVRSTLAQRG